MRRVVSLVASLAAVAVLLGSCATEKLRSKETILDDTLHAYAATLRWGEIDQAANFIQPKQRLDHPPSAVEISRLKQFKVSGYNEQPPTPAGENEVHQLVQIDLVNINTQSARSIVDHQVWKYDDSDKHWWLVSGLPDLSHHD
jgi:hypothetical protein